MNRKIGSYILLALLVLSTIAVAVPLIATPAKSQGTYSAWLKVVTTSWDGAACPGLGPSPMCPKGLGFADRFNVTGQEAFVEVYSIKYDTLAVQHEGGPFEPNETGFVKISWSADPSEHALMIVVKAKSYYGERIGEGELWKGIIMYALFIPPSNPATDYGTFAKWLGVFTTFKPHIGCTIKWQLLVEHGRKIYCRRKHPGLQGAARLLGL
ncbi:MAG: hypothetical protein NZ918_04945 [Aigarchaeota archaeon]|nr:hypothetical protein [Aigarchaeota archaeon]